MSKPITLVLHVLNLVSMKSIIFNFIFLTGLLISSHSYGKNCSDTLQIYKSIIKTLKQQHPKLSVAAETNKSYFKDFNFKNPSDHTLGLNDKKIWERSDWRFFLNNVEIDKIRDFELKSNNKLWFKRPAKKREIAGISFSPIIFSLENNKAFCISNIKTGTSGSIVVWFYEKENNSWVYKDFITLKMYD